MDNAQWENRGLGLTKQGFKINLPSMCIGGLCHFKNVLVAVAPDIVQYSVH